MKTAKVAIMLTAIFLLLSVFTACSAGLLFSADGVSEIKLVTLPDNTETILTEEERTAVIDKLLKAKLTGKPDTADSPTPTHKLVFNSSGTAKDEYTLWICDVNVNDLSIKKDDGEKQYWIRDDALNATVSAIVKKYTIPNVYKPGDSPYPGLIASEVKQVRIIQYSDAQPPDWPDPYKDITNEADIKILVNIAVSTRIKGEIDFRYIPIGETGYSLTFTQTNGEIVELYLYGDHIVRIGEKLYEIDKLTHNINSVFKSQNGVAGMLPDK